MGERLHREFQREVEGRAAGQGAFYTLLAERYRRTYNQVSPHSSLGYRPPAPEALVPADPVPVLLRTNITGDTNIEDRSIYAKAHTCSLPYPLHLSLAFSLALRSETAKAPKVQRILTLCTFTVLL